VRKFGLSGAVLMALSAVVHAKPSVPLVAPPPPPPPAEEAAWSEEPGALGYLLRARATAYEVGQVGGFAAKLRIAGGVRYVDTLPASGDAVLYANGLPWMTNGLTLTRELVRGWWLEFGLQSTRTLGDVLRGSAQRRLFQEGLVWVALRY